MKKKYIFCFDIDNVICKTINKNYKTSKPNKKAISKINELYENEHFIKLFTGRYMGRNKENIIAMYFFISHHSKNHKNLY